MTRRAAAAFLLLAACAPPPRPGAPPAPETPPMTTREALPPIPPQRGALALSVEYPSEGAALTAADSNFIFGSAGTGEAALTIGGHPVEVAPNGAFLAFLPVPADGVYRLRASAGGRTAELERRVRVPAPSAGALAEAVIDSASVSPAGTMTVAAGERVTVRVRGAPGADVRVVLPDGRAFPLVAGTAEERDGGFMRDVSAAPRTVVEYAGSFPALPLRAPTAPEAAVELADPAPGAGTAMVEGTLDGRTVRHPLALTLAVLREGETRTAVAAGGRPDGMVIGVARSGGDTPYHWLFPDGTRFTVTGERAGELRVRLTDALSVWIAAGQLRLLPPGTPPVAGTVGTVRAVAEPEWVALTLSTSDRLPFAVRLDGRALSIHVFGARSRTNWLHYGPEDPFLHRLSWDQVGGDEFVVRAELAEAPWGWSTAWDEAGRLVVRVRRPPPIDPARPLAGIRVAVDAGHPPGGAIGPTGYTEAEANLAIVRRWVPMLRAAGAEVLEIRPDTAAVGLGARPLAAEAWNAHVLVSVHNNAFPDGVNPWVRAGTSVFYNQPQSLEIARWMQRELLAELGLRDLGIARADLALVRTTWMPSVLTEAMFLMIPAQEAALRNPAVQERIARAHQRALEHWLRERAAER